MRASTITALSGHDRIETGGDALSVHAVWAGSGNDTLIPGPGADSLVGGAGADTFVIRHLSGWNRIADFDPAEGDVLALGRGLWEPRFGPMTAAEVVAAFGRIAGGGDMVLDFGSADAIVRLVGLDDPAALAGAITIL